MQKGMKLNNNQKIGEKKKENKTQNKKNRNEQSHLASCFWLIDS